MCFDRSPQKPSRLAAILALLVGLAAVSVPGASGQALAGGPFSGIIGLWGGNGTVTYASGTKERLRCRAQYIQNDEDNLQQALRCASDSYNFQINAYFEHTNGAVSGRWEELVLEISGTVSGTARAGRIDGSLHGPGFVAELMVTTTGNRQKVRIVTPDQEIRRVDIEVRKVRRTRSATSRMPWPDHSGAEAMPPGSGWPCRGRTTP